MTVSRLMIAGLVLVATPLAVLSAGDEISGARKDDSGFLMNTVNSPLQAGKTEIRLLLPSRLEEGKRYRVVYVLPVEPNQQTRYGDGLREVQRHSGWVKEAVELLLEPGQPEATTESQP